MNHVTKYNPHNGDPDMKMFQNFCSTIQDVNFVLEHLCSKGHINVIETNRLHDMDAEIRILEVKNDAKWYSIKPNHYGFDVPGDHWKPSDRDDPVFNQFCDKYARMICAIQDMFHPQ